MTRIKFQKGKSQGDDLKIGQDLKNRRPQREFLKKVLEKTNCPSLIELINRGFDISYSTLKNYFNESRSLPENLFNDLCNFANIDKKDLTFVILENNWGQSKGGKISRKFKLKNI